MIKTQTEILAQIADDLSQRAYCILSNAVPSDILERLRKRLQTLPDQDFHQAGIGRAQDHNLDHAFRSDRIHWLEATEPEEAVWLDWANELRLFINQQLFMGLQNYESHFAHYAPGQHYRKHIDAFKGQANRVLTTVLYLNETWKEEDGGELLLYHDPNQDPLRISPAPGRLIIFLSEGMPHEVLPARKDRFSIAGWFRVRSDSSY